MNAAKTEIRGESKWRPSSGDIVLTVLAVANVPTDGMSEPYAAFVQQLPVAVVAQTPTGDLVTMLIDDWYATMTPVPRDGIRRSPEATPRAASKGSKTFINDWSSAILGTGYVHAAALEIPDFVRNLTTKLDQVKLRAWAKRAIIENRRRLRNDELADIELPEFPKPVADILQPYEMQKLNEWAMALVVADLKSSESGTLLKT